MNNLKMLVENIGKHLKLNCVDWRQWWCSQLSWKHSRADIHLNCFYKPVS